MAFKFEIKTELGVLSENQSGWTKELNLVSWNEHPEKFDLREWNPDHDRMGKGITLSFKEAMDLRDLLDEFDFESALEKELEEELGGEIL